MKTVIYLMALYNTEKYVGEAIDSVIKSFKYAKNQLNELETYLIIRNDGSTDSSKYKVQEKMKQYSNIILLDNDKNIGILETRRNLFLDAEILIKNKNIINIKDIYLSIIDSDDICIETRVINQINTLSNDSSLMGCGGQILMFQENPEQSYSSIGLLSKYKTNYEELKVDSIFQSSALSPTMSFKYEWIKKRIDNYERKDWWAKVRMGEDWAAIVDFMSDKNFKYIHSNDLVLLYRKHPESMTSIVTDGINTDQSYIRNKALSYINLELSEQEHLLHITISPCRHWEIYNVDFFHKNQKNIYEMSAKLLNKIISANEQNKFYNSLYLKEYTDHILQNIKKYENLNLDSIPILLKIT